MKASALAIACLLVISLVWMYPTVEAAQTTQVYQVISPSNVIAGSQNPIPVSVTVYFNNTVAGYQLDIGILDAGLSPQRIVPGVVISSSDPCVNQPEIAALCDVTTQVASGVERVDFQIGGIFGGRTEPGTWDLNVTSLLVDVQNNPVPGSVSSKLVAIRLRPVALNVTVPPSVAVSVDNVQQAPGPAVVGVSLGQHNLTVPMIVQTSTSTRLRFDHWSDGYPAVSRSLTVTNTTSLEAFYVTQNLLTLVGTGQNGTVTGWYDADTNANFSANQSEPIGGLLGAFGGKLSFQGWYENGQLITASPTGTIVMETPHTLTAVWKADYSVPAAVTLMIIAALIVVLLVLHRRKRTSRRRRRKSRRKHS